MKLPFILRRGTLLIALAGLVATPLAGFADDLTPPIIVSPLHDITVAEGARPISINLKKTFGLKSVKGPVVRMATVAGNIDIELFSSDSPKNVANFLAYVKKGNFNKSFVHRSVPGFVIQGGGYFVDGTGTIDAIPPNDAVTGEHVRPNARGTIALALSSGPDSGTSQWFFNLADNKMLDDTTDGGPFTAFGRVIEDGMTTVDAIGALPEFDFSSQLGSPFTNLPLFNYDSSKPAGIENLVYINDAEVIPTVPATAGADAVLKLKVKSSVPNLVVPTLSGVKLKLAFKPDKTGTASIKVFATDAAGTQIKAHFGVTVK